MQATSMRTSLFHGRSNTVGRKIFHSVCRWPQTSPSPLKVKANDSAVTKAKKDLAIVGLFGESIIVTMRKMLVGATYNAGEADSHVSKNLSKTSFKEEKYFQRNTVQGPLQAMEAGRVKWVEKLRIT